MNVQAIGDIQKSGRIDQLKEEMFSGMPEVESARAVLLTESYMQTEHLPMIKRRSAAFRHILEHLPIIIRYNELIVGSLSLKSRGCQVYPEYSFEWLEEELDTLETRSADPFHISEQAIKELRAVFPYWKGKTTSELASSYMAEETKLAIEHNIFTPGNYYYNGVGHVTVDYGDILAHGYEGILAKAEQALAELKPGDAEYCSKTAFLEAVIESCHAVVTFANRYAALARQEAEACVDPNRKEELLIIAKNCERVPAKGARNFYEACQSFWFVQMLIQIESSGHSISPGRFDQYMYPYFKKDFENGTISLEFAQELIDCVWLKMNDFTKVRDKASAEGFAGYSLFQNLCAGGQTKDGLDATNELSYMTIQATLHVFLPQPSFSVRAWNGSPQSFLLKAAELTRTGIGLPAYYNDEVIIPALISRGLTIEDARDYNIIGCVEPQKSGKTDGWHDAAFFNMCRPMELVFSNGMDKGIQLGPQTGDVTKMTTFDEFYNAYKTQMNYMIELLVNADNAIDKAHAERCPLPYLSGMIEDCIGRGKSVQEGGAVYNFTGPQGFGIANMADALYAVKKLVFEEKSVTMAEYKQALEQNFNLGNAQEITDAIVRQLTGDGISITADDVASIYQKASSELANSKSDLLKKIEALPKFGNDIDEVDQLARDVAYTYTKPLEQYKNPRGGQYQAGLYPVSANVPLGAQTGATPDGRLAFTPIADGVSPAAGRDTKGPTAAANSVSRLDHSIASNGTLYNMKFHPSALKGMQGLENFIALIRAYFDQKGSHVQFNVVSRETLKDAQKHPENYKNLVVRVAGYSALFTTLSRSLQDDIINRTEQRGF